MRVAGTHLNDLMGYDVRGMPITAMIAPGHRRTCEDALEHVFRQPAQAHLALKCPDTGPHAGVIGCMVLLPLRSDLGGITRILGCLVTKGSIHKVPNRFDIAETRLAPAFPSVNTTKPADPARMPRAEAEPIAMGFAEDAPDFQSKPSRVPYLRVVTSDKSQEP